MTEASGAATHKKDVQIVRLVLEACQKHLKIDIVRHGPLHLLYVNVIWALLEDAQKVVKELSELRLTHNMNIEDQMWSLDERLTGSKPDRLRGCSKFFEIPPICLSTSLSRRNSYLGESSFKDFRDYCKGTVTNFSVSSILHHLDKLSQMNSFQTVIKRNVKESSSTTGGRNVR